MAISVNYMPMDAVAQLALAAGYGQARQQQWENQFRETQLAQHDQQQQRAIAADIYGQQVGIAANLQQQAMQQAAHQQSQLAGMNFDAWRQQQQIGQQQQWHADQLRQRDLETRYGLYWREMGDIRDLEAKGFQYSPEEQMRIKRLESDIGIARADDSLNEQQKAEAEAQFYRKRIMIRPTAPPRPSAQDEFDAEGTVTGNFPDGSVGFFTVSRRADGSRMYKPVESPIEKTRREQIKLDQQQRKEQASLRSKAFTDYQRLQKDLLDIEHKVAGEIAKLPSDLEARVQGVANYNRAAEAEKIRQAAAVRQQSLRDVYVMQHGQVADPRLLQSLGVDVGAMQPDAPQLPGGWDDQTLLASGMVPPNFQQPPIPEPVGQFWPDQWPDQQQPGPQQQQPVPAPESPEQLKLRDAMIAYMKTLPQPKSREEFKKLPKGARYVENGQIWIKGE